MVEIKNIQLIDLSSKKFPNTLGFLALKADQKSVDLEKD